MIKTITILSFFVLAVFLAFLAFQKPAIYNRTLGKISHNYEMKEDGNREHVKKPYSTLNNTTVIQWDGAHYEMIKDNGYNQEIAHGDYIFAFFPLFPYIWKLTGLPAVGTVFLNFFMFAISILLLVKLFKGNFKTVLLICCLPFIVVFLIPYTEATFLLMCCIGLYGYFKEKYWIYLIGIVLASLSRNSFSILLPAIFCTEILFFIKEKQIKQSIKRLLGGIFPIFLGTAIFVLLEYFQGSGSLFKFIEVQSQWDNNLSVPDIFNIRDWSHEGFGVNVPILILIGMPILVYLGAIFFAQCSVLKSNKSILRFTSSNKTDYAIIVALLCLLAAVCSVVLYRGGSLHGLSRFVLCSPYFILLLFIGFEKIKDIKLETRIIWFAISVIIATILFCKIPYCGEPLKFWHLGFPLLISSIGLFVFKDLSERKIYQIVLYSTFLINIVWTSYLFNMYLCNGWIYT